MKPRGLRYRLRPQDTIRFLHLYSTGGLAVRGLVDTCLASAGGVIEEAADGSVPTWKEPRLLVTRGQEPLGADLGRSPIRIAMLRDPVDRVVSLYHRAASDSDHSLHMQASLSGSIEAFLRKSDTRAHTDNAQTLSLAGVDEGSFPDDVVLDMAKINLDEHAFFGLTHRLGESLHLLCETFHWEPPGEISMLRSPQSERPDGKDPTALHGELEAQLALLEPFLRDHVLEDIRERPTEYQDLAQATLLGACGEGFAYTRVNPARPRIEAIDARILDRIESRNRLDRELFRFAEAYFDERLKWVAIEKDLANT